MKGFVHFFAALFFSALISTEGIASHNRAGEITYEWQSGFTYKITIVTYTKASSQADRCELEVEYSDNTVDTLFRQNGTDWTVCGNPIGSGELVGSLGTDIQMNIYIGYHTFPGPGVYVISMLDPNRNEGVENMLDSFNTPFFIQTILMISSDAGFENNSSPSLLNPPIEDACSGKLFIHNPGAFDSDGDSLSYHMVECFEAPGTVVQGFFPPADLTINATTGDVVWNLPPNVINTSLGYDEYNIAFEIWEHRSGLIVGKVLRDMQITVYDCENNPPVIANLADTCILAGSLLTTIVTATDQDGDAVTLSASGGPLLVINPATFVADPPPSDTVTGTFSWQTDCFHVQNQPYSVVFRAEDNSPEVVLVDLENYRITVIAPAPTGLTVAATGNNINLSWDVSVCSNATGYKIYRRNGSFPGTIDCPCETGIPAGSGYTLINTVLGLNNTSFLDNNNGAGLIHGEDYCYRIVACFNDGAQSCASDEQCDQLNRDVPVITHVSVGITSDVAGIDTIRWSKPAELDTLQYAGPYKYNIYRSDGFTNADTFIGSTASNNFLYLADTSFVDVGLSSSDGPYAYKVEIISGSALLIDTIGSTHIASSIFLTTAPSDNQVLLTWEEDVPWTNTQYVVYKRDNGTGLMTIILDTVSTQTYSDTGLANGVEYCYVIKSMGSYSISGIVSPIVNFSQINCDMPVDLTPPCSPTLTVTPDCENFENTLAWNNPNLSCADDVVQYNIYYTPVFGGTMVLLDIISSAQTTSLSLAGLTSVAGCYTITALDSFQNESIISDSVCVENCPVYSLPNVFSPDGSGVNDRFIPFPYRFVDKIDLIIYNRWGMKVFESTDPDINWDGNYYKNNEPCSEGVYFYICYVDVIKLARPETITLTGFIHIIRDGKNNTN